MTIKIPNGGYTQRDKEVRKEILDGRIFKMS